MFRPNDNSRGIQGLRTRGFRKVVPVMALALGTGGCLVTASTYEAKTREADTLREAVAFANKEKGTIETRLLASEKQISSAKEENTILSGRLRAVEGELRTVKEESASIVGKYEGTRITREELISELLEKEKATGKRIQELNARAQACEASLESLRNGKPGDNEALIRERDILLGRV